MSNSEPSAIVLHDMPCIGGLYISFDSSGEIGSLFAQCSRRFSLSKSRMKSRTGFARGEPARGIAEYARLRVHRHEARVRCARSRLAPRCATLRFFEIRII